MSFTYDNPAVRSLLDPNSVHVPDKSFLKEIILSKESPIAAKLSAISFCRDTTVDVASDILLDSLKVHFDPLIRHEIIYALGQALCITACHKLIGILEDESEHFIAAEALATIRCTESLPVIKKYLNHPIKAIRDTCILSEYCLNQSYKSSDPKTYITIDPIQANGLQGSTTTEYNIKMLNDPSEELYKRYESLFYFRSRNTDDSARIIGDAMINDKISEVFRHECAFVLGQLQNPVSYSYLIRCLEDINESPMVRHEAAIALGSVATGIIHIDGENDVVKTIKKSLKKFNSDSNSIVADSCIVAIDNIEFAK